MKPILSLSSSWNSGRHADGYEMAKEAADLGFAHMELSHGIRVTLVPGILRALRENVIQVSSVHNFCPLPPGVDGPSPNLFEPTAQKRQEIEQWVRYTKRSIDFAKQVGARILVVHLGSVHFFLFNPAKKLESRFERAEGGSLSSDSSYLKLREVTLAKLRKQMKPFLLQLRESLEAVRAHALENEIRLGFENREAVDELPLDSDFGPLFGSLKKPNTAGYWHDTGHAHIKECMQLLDHRQHLETNAERLLGFHLHDVNAQCHDHQPVGSGAIDFKMISTFWRPHHTFVIELSPRVSREEVLLSRDRVKTLIAESPAGAPAAP